MDKRVLTDISAGARHSRSNPTKRDRIEWRLAALADLGRQLSGARSAPEAARVLAYTADVLIGWDACVLDLCTPDMKSFRTVYCADLIDGDRQEIKPSATEPGGLSWLTLMQGPQLILRAPGEAPDPTALPFGHKDRPSRSLMFVPIRRGDLALGMFSIQSYRTNAYTPEDLKTLQGLVDHCVGALERIRVEVDLQAQLAERQKAEQEILRLNAELERRVQERTEQLEAINRELEAFAYSVSHDLRAPLRSIRGFSEVLLERYSDALDERGRDFLRRACESSQHMDRLIEDLLKLSRVSRAELRRLPVDLSCLATDVANDLRRAEPDRRVEFVIAPELRATGDERLLRVVLDNLLRNAWKFTGKAAKARIEFGRTTDGERAFFVRDNGAGFEMQYAGRLFGVFQRLHSGSEFPGTGVGLATVQRIISRHGGRVWAKGAVGQGAEFYFTLPESEGS